jgi:hypothetical protein
MRCASSATSAVIEHQTAGATPLANFVATKGTPRANAARVIVRRANPTTTALATVESVDFAVAPITRQANVNRGTNRSSNNIVHIGTTRTREQAQRQQEETTEHVTHAT